MSRSLRPRLAVLVHWLALSLVPCAAHAVDEGELKAAIVYNILLFVEWPHEALPEAGGPLSLCVTPASSIAAPLKALNHRPLRGFRLEVRELKADDASACHAVFVDAADRARLAASLKMQRARGALVLSDDADAPADSTAIVLQPVGARIAFDVNLQPVRQARLQLSSKLLRLARVVRE
ncbi:MAG TPA: YfiR family protein [Albitalea sp.]|nr:YfiR family protein [Albitalea sp.]